MQRSLIINSILATLFTSAVFLVIKVAVAPFLHAVNPVAHLSTHFDYTDLYYSRLSSNSEVDTSIVLVNIGEADRSQLAHGIMQICAQDPSVIGLDFVLSDFRRDLADTLLAAALDSCRSVVMSHYVDRSIDGSHSFFGKPEHSGHNLLHTDQRGIVREVMMTDTEHSSLAFSKMIAEAYVEHPTPCEDLVLLAPSGTYHNFLHGELSGNTSAHSRYNIHGKIVLLGYAGSKWGDKSRLEDKHYFPSEISMDRLEAPKTEGVVIHAVAVSNLIHQNFIYQAPQWLSIVIALIVLLACNYFYFYHFVNWSIPFFLKCRLFQLCVTAAMLIIIFLVFHMFRWKVDFTLLLAAPVASLDFASLYISLLKALNKRFDLSDNYVIKKS